MTCQVILSLLLLTSVTACTDDSSVPSTVRPLSLDVHTSAVVSRGVIETGSLPDGHSVGLFFAELGSTTYGGTAYHNVMATASTGLTPQTWSLDNDILLSERTGTLHAYYPYSPSVTYITRVPVSSGSTDYMYATPVTGLCYATHQAAVSMHHALSALRLSLSRGTYTGAGRVSGLSVQSLAIATGAQLDALFLYRSGYCGYTDR